VAVASYGLLTAIAGTLAIGLGLAAAHPACRVGSNTRST